MSESSQPVPPIEIDARALPPLGMSPAEFLRVYWQKRPLLIRNAFPDFVSPMQPDDLAGLACEDGALSRLISHDKANDRWAVQHGPFPEEMFPGLPHQDWTLLVQDVDKWDADIAELIRHFSFLPRWRIDDVMVSFAAPGGSVGAHVDQYDVFLLQAVGHRRWQIDATDSPPLDFRDDVELRLLRQFTPSHDWVLGPGDMLYLPPGVPHHGVAEDACLTFSFGMRAPSAAELLGDLADTLAAAADESSRYRDPGLTPADDPGEIDAAAMTRVIAALDLLRSSDPEQLGDWFGNFITVYRNAVDVIPPELPPGELPRSRIEIEWDLQHGAVLHRHPYSRMAWRQSAGGARLHANGEGHSLPVADAKLVANAPTLDGTTYAALSETGRNCVFDLIQAGHYHLALDEDDEA
ncbi:transcriptional regulator [Lysobacter concretionis Ko07 = DSM 16239]|uniref:Transcriptional regulator n=1 Tax=Lysobacter concretionis Ko07 = DSM 16239 TaxID=1122185 RepID=A0A0A0EM94_9GAMM|nr:MULTISPECIES: cupin domain-containing protein [Lysobacter]KGM52136.1 transcriptional regulator [Lysobacter concretionis Ko07 = DSM 16239]QOD90122.1 cupin domain-containing protein [Lysobacter sp. CW239]